MLVKFTGAETGGEVWVNPDHVIRLGPPIQGYRSGCTLLLTDGDKIPLQGTPRDVAAILAGGA